MRRAAPGSSTAAASGCRPGSTAGCTARLTWRARRSRGATTSPCRSPASPRWVRVPRSPWVTRSSTETPASCSSSRSSRSRTSSPSPRPWSTRSTRSSARCRKGSAVVYATMMVALVFLPVFLLGGLEGALFRPLALAYVLATLASLGVALTVTPALALVLLPRAVARRPAPPRLMVALRRGYERALARALARPAPILAGSLAAIALAVGLTPLTHLEFLPEFHETNFVMHMTGAPGVGFAESLRVGAAVEKRLLAVRGVRSVAQVIGRSTLSEDVWGPERSEMMVQLAHD